MFKKPFSSFFRYLLGVILVATLLAMGFLPSARSQAASSIKVQIDKGGGTDNAQETTFNFLVKNTGTAAVSGVSVRIYFSPDGSNAASSYVMEKYYDQSGVATISSPTLLSGSTYYFTVGYGTASLAAGGQWEFQTALHLNSWASTFSGANDYYHTGYAVGALPASYTDTNYITAYVSGTLAWGTEPGGGTPTNTFIPPPTTVIPPTTLLPPPTVSPSPTPCACGPTPTATHSSATPIPLPDLTISSLTQKIDACNQSQIHVIATVANIGNVSAKPFVLQLSETSSISNSTLQQTVNGLAAGQSIAVDFYFPVPGLVTAFADSTYVITELNETNNTASITTQLVPGPCNASPTYTPGGPSVTPTFTFTPTNTPLPSATPTIPTATPTLSNVDSLIEGNVFSVSSCGGIVPVSGAAIMVAVGSNPASQAGTTDAKGNYFIDLGNFGGQSTGLSAYATSKGINAAAWYWGYTANTAEHYVFNFQINYPAPASPTPIPGGPTYTPTATGTPCFSSTPTITPVTPSSMDVSIQGHVTTPGVCGAAGVANMPIYVSFNDTPSVQVALTDSTGFYKADLGNANGQQTTIIVTVWPVSDGSGGVVDQFTPAYYDWVHPAGQSESKVIDFSIVAGQMSSPTPSGTCAASLTPTKIGTASPTPSITPSVSSLPDLTVTSITTAQATVPCGPGWNPGTNVTVANSGNANAGSFVVSLSNTGGASATLTVSGLAAGQSITLRFNINGGLLTATADSTNVIVESNESNNSVTASLPVVDPLQCTSTPTPGIALPDLYVARINYGPRFPGTCSNNLYTLVDVTNSGAADAGPFDVYAQNGSLTRGQNVPGLAAGQTITLTFDIGGFGTITATADMTNHVVESNENNNSLTVQLAQPTNIPCPTMNVTNTPTITLTPSLTPFPLTTTPTVQGTCTPTPTATTTFGAPSVTPSPGPSPTPAPTSTLGPCTQLPKPSATPSPTKTNTPVPTNTLPATLTPNPSDPCASPTVITGGGSFNISTATTCFKYVNTSFVNGGMFSIMKDSTSTSDTVKWYGGMDQNATTCANQNSTISGNGGQLNNFTVAKDANGQMFLIITGTGSNSVTISIQNWQNGAGCSVKPTVHP